MYKLFKHPITNSVNIVQKIEENSITSIPFDEANADYQVYLKWLDGYEIVNNEWVKTSEGNTPEPADEPSQG